MINKKKIRYSHTQHRDQSDCGVVCLQTVLKFYDSEYSLEKLRDYSGTNKQGTTMLGLLQCGNKIGLDVKGFRSTIDDLKKIKSPVILHTNIDNKLQHFIVCFGFESNKFIISNPSNSDFQFLEENELNLIWKSKALLTCDKTKHLKPKVKLKKEKWEWIYNYVKEDLNLLITSLFIGIILSILSLATAIYSQKLIDVLLPTNNKFKIASSVVLLLFLFTIQVFFGYLRNLFLIRQTKNYNSRVINFFYSNLLKLPKRFFDTRKTGDMIARMNDTSRIQKTITKIIGSIMIDVLMIVVVSISIFNYNQMLGILALLWLPLFIGITIIFNPKIKNKQQVVMQSYARNESNYIETIESIKTIKANNREEYYSNNTNEVYNQFLNSVYDLGKLSLSYSVINQFLSNFFIILTLSYSLYLVLNGELTAGMVIALLQLVGMLMGASSKLALINIEVQEAKVAFNRMFEFTSVKKEEVGKYGIKNFYSLDIKDISFRFPGRSEILRNVNISIEKGSITAIVGESGSGKSTISEILLRFYDFDNGSIVVNKQFDLRSLNLKDWRNLIGVVPQEVTVFNGSLLENILLGQKDEIINVINFCKELGFEDYIMGFPQGYETILGEEGVNLSGGQKQILALIRALYKKPQFLILDEATASMDRKTEKFSIELVNKLKDKVGVLFISHRLETLKRYADVIYVLEKGETTIKGNHIELLKTSNFYSDYWRELELT